MADDAGGPMAEDVQAELAALAPRLRRFAYALTGSVDEGDDLVQASCVKALNALHQYEPGTRLDSWMFRIVRTGWIDRVRMRARRPQVSDPEAIERLSDGGRAAAGAEARVALAQVRALMMELPPAQREALALVAIEGLSYRDAAETLGVPVGTVMSRLARARASLTARVEGSAR